MRIINLVVIGKLIAIFTIFVHGLQHKFVSSQVLELFLIIAPQFAMCLTMALLFSSFSKNETTGKGMPLNALQGLIGNIFPIVYALCMIVVLTVMPSGTAEEADSFGQMKTIVGSIEIILGFYTGFLTWWLLQRVHSELPHQKWLLANLSQFQQQVKVHYPHELINFDTKELKQLLSKGKVKEVIEILSNVISNKGEMRDLLNQLINLSSQYHIYNEQRRLSLIKDDTVANQVIHGLLQIIDDMQVPHSNDQSH